MPAPPAPRAAGRPRRALALLLAALLAAAAPAPAAAGERTHSYKDGERVVLWVNKVGPFNNPQETYNYYGLPYCRARPEERPTRSWGGLGEVLQGNELIDSQLDIKFKVPVPKTTICEKTLEGEDVTDFGFAIERQYWFELFVDDLPLWGYVGEARRDGGEGDGLFLYPHWQLDISYNGNQIIHVNLTQHSNATEPLRLANGVRAAFTYSVSWSESDTPFDRRFEKYLDYSFFEHKIHWFSIVNSFMMVMFLVGLVTIILMRTLRRDYARYAREEGDLEALERDLAEETGWKLVHGDVFRPPRHRMLLAAAVGTGMQLALLGLATILVTIMGTLFEERGTILTVFIVTYALTSFVGGYVSGGLYAAMEGKHWMRAMVLTAVLFPGFCCAVASFLNTIAIAYGSLAAVPFWYIVIVVLLWAFLSIPLCVAGTIVGRRYAGAPENPCRVKRIPSPIPVKPWYLSPWAVAAAGGLLPFGSIFIEMYFIFTSFWNYKVYYVYGFMLLVFLIMIVVAACVSVVGSYFLLNAENYHWQWASFGMAGSTAGYVGLYAVHYYLFKTRMSGFFQTAFYFGYTSMICFGLALACGAIGYWTAAAFVRTIYRQVKCD
ncbi:hypothetical protein Rsub_06759 [Raphidocelis subcapitata]|uniref:Transmembrane 9 superfamily member n=1 Tax=Raphidocelis subcapitata TaxID=307507 RepID=A0A2V0P1A8_9CHLO|nr:hypothetical protein Rsub_06759 [Raphidocelis subcapitata]|eukprot:GBF93656.1 hypothetical protein Rsub_06759 [Raphidocelis subcapitata]